MSSTAAQLFVPSDGEAPNTPGTLLLESAFVCAGCCSHLRIVGHREWNASFYIGMSLNQLSLTHHCFTTMVRLGDPRECSTYAQACCHLALRDSVRRQVRTV